MTHLEMDELRRRVKLLEARTEEHDRVLGALITEFRIRQMEAERLGPARETSVSVSALVVPERKRSA